MHDIQNFRANLEAIVGRLAARGFSLDREQFLAIDQRRRTALTDSQQLAAQINAESKEIGKLRQAGLDTGAQQEKVKSLKQQVADLEQAARDADDEFLNILKGVPNVPHESVPTGKSAEDNVEVRREGTPRDFDFEPKAHWDLGPALGILDFERAAKITGARFAVYWDMGAKLERALVNFMLDTHGREHGYREVFPPVVVNSASLYGTGQLPKFAEDLFKLENTDYYLAPTAEVPVTNLFRDETLDVSALPIKLCAYTSCFRSEAGAYGRDVRGIIRQHQFQKVELVKFTTPEQSLAELEALTHDAEDILRKLGLPFRTVLLCTGDMGFSSCKTYDIEVWLPSQREFKEISSCSCFGDFQARRANIRQRTGKKTEFLHTLNGSGLAVGRTWVAIVENYQQADGSVLVPEVLRPYLNTDRLVPAR